MPICECVVILLCSGNRIHCGYSFPITIIHKEIQKVNYLMPKNN